MKYLAYVGLAIVILIIILKYFNISIGSEPLLIAIIFLLSAIFSQLNKIISIYEPEE